MPILKEILFINTAIPNEGVNSELLCLHASLSGSAADSKVSYYSSWANEPWVFGALARSLASQEKDRATKIQDVIKSLDSVVQKWYWSEHAMAGAAKIAKKVYVFYGSSTGLQLTSRAQ